MIIMLPPPSIKFSYEWQPVAAFSVLLHDGFVHFYANFTLSYLLWLQLNLIFPVGKPPNLLLFQNYVRYSDPFALPSELQDHHFLLEFLLKLYSVTEYFRESFQFHHIMPSSLLNILCLSICSGLPFYLLKCFVIFSINTMQFC